MFIIDLIRYWKLKRFIDKIDKEEHITQNLSELFKSKFKIDYVGRRYTILNPRINYDTIDDSSGYSSQIYEFTEDGMVDYSHVEKWCMDRIHAISIFLVNKSLLDVMCYSLNKLDDDENYLFVLKPILFDDLKISFKKMIKRLSIISILIIISIILILFLKK